MNYSEAETLPKIDFYIYNYDTNESNKLINKIRLNFKRIFRRNMEVRKFGNGICKDVEELIRFHLIEY